MNKILTLILLYLLILCSIPIYGPPLRSLNSPVPPNSPGSIPEIEKASLSRGNETCQPLFREEGLFGGSWFDDFNDERGVEWMENVSLRNGEVRTKWLDGWKYRRSIDLANNGSILNDYPVQLDLTSHDFNYSRAKGQGEDVRYIDMNGSALNYWIEEWNTSGASKIWVNVSEIPPGSSRLWMYYGNPTADTVANASRTFSYYDDWTRDNTRDWKHGTPDNQGNHNTYWENSRTFSFNKTLESRFMLKDWRKGEWDWAVVGWSSDRASVWDSLDHCIVQWNMMGGAGATDSKIPIRLSLRNGTIKNETRYRLVAKPDPNHNLSLRLSFNTNRVTYEWKNLDTGVVLARDGITGYSKIPSSAKVRFFFVQQVDSKGGIFSWLSPTYLRWGNDHFNGGGEWHIDEWFIRKNVFTDLNASIGIEHQNPLSYLVSKSISLPLHHRWSSLSVIKEEPLNTNIGISIIDNSTNGTIPGYGGLAVENINISNITATNIRLKGVLLGNGSAMPWLDSWGVEWNRTDCFRDSFTGDGKCSFPEDMDRHTVGYWDFDKGDGNSVSDLSRNGNHGTVHGVDRVHGRFGKGLEFDGENDHVDMGGRAVPRNDNAWSDIAVRGGRAQLRFNEIFPETNTSALWHFNEGESTISRDSTGNGYDGEIQGAGWTEGRFGQGLEFDGGAADRVVVPHMAFNGIPFTISAWVRLNSITADQPILSQDIIPARNALLHCVVRNGRPCLGFYNNDLLSNTVLSTGKWYHLVFQYNGSHQRIYIDGSPDSGRAARAYEGTGGKTYIGFYNSDSFNGTIDEVCIYNRSLTSSEISNLSRVYHGNAVLRSVPVRLPRDHVWGIFHFNRSVPENTYLNISVHNAETDEELDISVENDNDRSIDLSSLNCLENSSVYFEAHFRSNRTNTPVLYDWAVNWSPIESPVLLDEIPDITVPEDNLSKGFMNLTRYFYDIYSHIRPPSYSIQYVAGSDNIILAINGLELDVVYLEENFTGNISLLINCTNYYDHTRSSNIFSILVINGNDPPVWRSIPPPIAVREGGTVTTDWSFDDHLYDAETDELEIIVSSSNNNISMVLENNNSLSVTAIGDSYGEISIEAYAREVHDHLQNTKNITIPLTITPVNDAPTLELLYPGDGATLGESNITLRWKAYDVDDEITDLSYTLYLDPDKDPAPYAADIPGTDFVISDLEEGIIYYWYVEPTDGEVTGDCINGIWSFKVNTSFEPVYNLSVTLEIEEISMELGKEGGFNITLVNGGNIPITISMSPSGLLLGFVDMTRNMVLLPGATENISVTIRAITILEPGEYLLVINISTPQEGIRTLTVMVNLTSGEGANGEPGGNGGVEHSERSGLYGSYLIIGVVIILVVLAAILFFMIRKRRIAERSRPLSTDESEPEIAASVGSGIGIERPGTVDALPKETAQWRSPTPMPMSIISDEVVSPGITHTDAGKDEDTKVSAAPVPPVKKTVPSVSVERKAEVEIPPPPVSPPSAIPTVTTPSPPPPVQSIPRSPQIIGAETGFDIDNIVLIYVDGRLIRSVSLDERAVEAMDKDVMGGMLAAITDFIKDSFKEDSGALKTLQHGKRTIYLERGVGMYLAVVFHGDPPPELRERMRMHLIRVWERYKYHLKVWDGTYEGLDGLDPMMKGIMEEVEEVEEMEEVEQVEVEPGGTELETPEGPVRKGRSTGPGATRSVAAEAVMCGVCMGVVKTGLVMITCPCGKKYHDSCANRMPECPNCSTSLKISEDALRPEGEILSEQVGNIFTLPTAPAARPGTEEPEEEIAALPEASEEIEGREVIGEEFKIDV